MSQSEKGDSPELPTGKRTRSNSGSRNVTTLDAVLRAVKDSEKRLLNEFKDMRSQLDSTVAELRLEFDKKLSELSGEVDVKISNALATAEIFKSVELTTTVDALALVTDLRIEALERMNALSDVAISGIPFVDGENVLTHFSKICDTISFGSNMQSVSSIFRIKPKSDPSSSQQHAVNESSIGKTTSSPPIIVKFINRDFSRQFMTCYLKYKTLNLSNIGFNTASRIYVNENLTKTNRDLFRHCITTKKNLSIIQNVFTKDGLVHVKFIGMAKPTYVRSINEFNDFCSKLV